ncbi:MAG: sulfatase [Verrucomicrobiota bacterium]
MVKLFTFVTLALFTGVSLAADRPNILFIAVDDLRPEISQFGEEHMVTPSLDRLAERGVSFERAFCMVPTCGASRASLMTGIRPARDRFLTHLSRADEDTPGIVTLNAHFKNHGYTTVSLGKIYHSREDSADGWSEKPWRASRPTYITPEASRQMVKDSKGRQRGPSWENGGAVPDSAYADGKLAEHAVETLGKLVERDEPFFLAVGFVRPHLPFNAPAKYFDSYPADTVAMPDNHFPPEGAPREAIHNWGELRNYSDIPKQGELSQEKALELIRGYRAATSYADAQIGRLLFQYDELGLAENTIIVLWGDHGWNLGEHTLWCKHSCFETSLRAPLIISAPSNMGVVRGQMTESIAEFIDVYPTLCDLAGLPKPEHLDGETLMPILKNPDAEVKQEAISRYRNGDTIRTKQFRYTFYRDTRGSETTEMLYDHRTDPGENVNVASEGAYSEVVADLKQRLLAGMGRPGDFRKSE